MFGMFGMAGLASSLNVVQGQEAGDTCRWKVSLTSTVFDPEGSIIIFSFQG